MYLLVFASIGGLAESLHFDAENLVDYFFLMYLISSQKNILFFNTEGLVLAFTLSVIGNIVFHVSVENLCDEVLP